MACLVSDLLPFIPQFDPDCFQYILDFWSTAHATFYGSPDGTIPDRLKAQQSIPSIPGDPSTDHISNPLLSKQPIIVLREELEYFSITKSDSAARTDITTGLANDELRMLKQNCGKALEERKLIFTALQRNVNKENNLAEQHLIDMLCMRCVMPLKSRQSDG